MKTKLHLIILCLLLSFVGGSSVIHAADTWSYPTKKPDGKFGGGSGSWYDPYLINNAQQLADLAYLVNEGKYYKKKYFKLTTDITLNDNVLNADGTPNTSGTFREWTPIGEFGSVWDDDFMGTFDGCGHTIRGLYIKKTAGDQERLYLGLFGSIKNATLKNINLEDCLISVNETKGNAIVNIGVLCGTSYQSSCVNVKVSKAYVSEENPGHIRVGGMLGWVYGDYEWSGPYLANSSFDGTISIINSNGDVNLTVGGLIGEYRVNRGDGIINSICKGNLYVDSRLPFDNDVQGVSFTEFIGGIVGLSSYGIDNKGEAYIKNCVNYMDIHFKTKKNAPDYMNVWSNVSAFTFKPNNLTLKNCVNFGNVYVTNYEDNGYSYNYLHLFGMRAYAMEDCANYGTFIFSEDSPKNSLNTLVSMEACKYTRCISVQTIDNIPDVTEETIIYPFKNGKEGVTDCHYYFKTDSPEGPFYADGEQFTLHEDLADFTQTKPLFSDGEWGVIQEEGKSYNGYPMPVVCGGVSTEYKGDGLSESTAYIINTEADLNKLKEYVNNGSTFEGKYFRLGSDISITGTLNECIGTYEHPFKGHFDGYSHAIKGLHKSLFGYMYGTVKNLALVDCDIWDGNYATALARQVGGTDNYAEVSNCYVSGIIASSTPWDQQGYASTFAFQVAKGSSIHDCYFKGRFVLKEQTFNTCNVAGIAVYDPNDVDTSADSPAGIFNCYASFDVKVESGWLTQYTCYGICNSPNDYSTDNYFICSDYRLSSNYCGGTKLDSESELNEKFAGKSGWLQGVYRPSLLLAKHYKAKSSEGEDAYFDAIPEVNPKKNYFYNISIDDPYSDVSLWSLPNMAVYVPSEQKDYITSGYLDQSSEFKYKRSEGATATLGQLHFALTQNDDGTHFICLPGEVLKSDLPEGSDVMIGGKVNIVNDEEQVNVVHVDTIPAGVPCLLYVPVRSVQSGEVIDILMRSGIVSEPVMNADYSSFKGTFKPQTVSEDACLDVAKETTARAAARSDAQDDTYYFIRGNEDTQVKPFSSWLEGSLGNVRIVDYMLLDEYNNTNVELIESSTDDANIKLRLTMDADKWTTVCLPFDMSIDEIKEKFGADTKLEEVESVSYEGSTLNIKLKEATDGIVSGSPYFIKPSVSNSIFDLGPRILSNELTEVGNLAFCPDANQEIYLKMSGWFDISMLQSAKEYNAYYFNDDTLCKLPREYLLILGGFRCWFKVSDATGSAPAELSSVIITHSDGTTTDVSVVASDPQSTKQNIYDLRGIEKKTEKGMYIKGGKLRIKN